MPTYDYLCGKCGHRFEEIQKMSDPPLKTCPKCRGKVKRIIGGGVGVIFKGSGFYVTDSRKSAAGAKGSRDGKTSKETTKTDGKTETKTEAKTETKTADKVSSS